MQEEETKVGVGVILINSRKKILLGKRLGSHGKGKYAFPGGHLEHKESFENCARREIKEETGLEIYLLNQNPVATTNDLFEEENKHYITVFMKAKNIEGEKPRRMEKDKCEKWEWYNWERFPKESELFLPIINLRSQGYNPFE